MLPTASIESQTQLRSDLAENSNSFGQVVAVEAKSGGQHGHDGVLGVAVRTEHQIGPKNEEASGQDDFQPPGSDVEKLFLPQN